MQLSYQGWPETVLGEEVFHQFFQLRFVSGFTKFLKVGTEVRVFARLDLLLAFESVGGISPECPDEQGGHLGAEVG